ncbi:Mobile element protein [Alloactinosynnema sp. L-07]|uniref:IS21 family transposase n=1 Tax=Alloactinosynnema sp. L-07 TaxID=1653480 RepID=UPI00065EFD8F|nr:IS21 family transposase [Alloactinosynnema sp. L-07]CRK56835.1 Mobile element protein [Alloactinosynnema sp. L-07]
MLSLEEDVEAQALREQGWSISAIARHLGRDRKTIRRYLAGEAEPGRRRPAAPDPFAPFVEYCRARLADDPHLWAATLLDELIELGYRGGYSSFTRALRRHRLRPHCEPCQAARGRDVAIITHPPGEATQWDWLELPDPPPGWGVGRSAHLLVGALAHSGRWRAVLADAEDFAHLVEAMDAVVRRLGGVTQVWRFDRMATVCFPSSGRITPAFAQVAKYYGVRSVTCPLRRGNRKGVVEKANHSAAQRWWRTLGDEVTIGQAQAGIDRLAAKMDDSRRVRDGEPTTVAALADAEHLHPAPLVAFPAEFDVARTVSPQALVSFRGNAYSVPPGLGGAQVQVRHRLGAEQLRIVTARGATVAVHRRAPDGAGRTVRDNGHVIALEQAALGAFTTARPCSHKTRRPPSAAALAEAARLRGLPTTGPAAHVVIDLSTYAATAARLDRAPTYESEDD